MLALESSSLITKLKFFHFQVKIWCIKGCISLLTWYHLLVVKTRLRNLCFQSQMLEIIIIWTSQDTKYFLLEPWSIQINKCSLYILDYKYLYGWFYSVFWHVAMMPWIKWQVKDFILSGFLTIWKIALLFCPLLSYFFTVNIFKKKNLIDIKYKKVHKMKYYKIS